MALSKKTIGKEALRQLAGIYELLRDANMSNAGFHAQSANNYIRSVQAAGFELPEWIERNRGFLRANNWRW